MRCRSACAPSGARRRELGRRAEDAALAALDAVLASRVGAEAVDRIVASDLAARAVGKALEGPLVDSIARDIARYTVLERFADGMLEDPELERLLVRVLDSKLLDEAVARLLEGDELWLVVDEIAQSPAVTEAITRQSIGFADQVAGGVRDPFPQRGCLAGARRAPGAAASSPEPVSDDAPLEPPVEPPRYEGLVTRAIAFAVDAAVIDLIALVVGVGVGLALSILDVPTRSRSSCSPSVGSRSCSGAWATSRSSGRRPGRRPATG